MTEFTPAGAGFEDDEDPFMAAGAAATVPNQIEEGQSYRKMPDPINGGKLKRFTRATRFAGTITDDYVLNEWKLAFAVIGLAHDDGLYADANSMPLPTEPIEYRTPGWWMPWAEIAHDAMDYAGSKTGARLGTAVHRWTEQIEYGQIRVRDVPKKWRAHAQALLRLREKHKLTMLPEYRERMILNRGVHNGVSGKYDSLLLGPDGRLIVDDTKTGKQVPKFGIGEIAVQLSVYANAEYMWPQLGDGPIFGFQEMPEDIRKDRATVTWIPIDRPEDAELIPIRIDEGWEQVKHVVESIRFMNKSKRKYNNLTSSIDDLFDGSDTLGLDVAERIRSCTSIPELDALIRKLFSDGMYKPYHVLLAKGVRHSIEIAE